MGFPWRRGPGEGGWRACGVRGGAQVGAERRPRLALQASGRRSPEPCGKPDKVLKRGAYDKVGARGQRAVGGAQGSGTGQASPGVPSLPLARTTAEVARPGVQRAQAACSVHVPPAGLHGRTRGAAPEADGPAGAQRAAAGTGGRRPGPRSWPRTRMASEGSLGQGVPVRPAGCRIPYCSPKELPAPPPPPPPGGLVGGGATPALAPVP